MAQDHLAAISRPATPRFDTVDVLRGISIILVVLLHARLRLSFAGASLKGTMPRWLAHLLFSNGDNGVVVFFAISGFLITLTAYRRFGTLANLSAATFYRIRFARIGPPLLLLLAILSALHLTHWEPFFITPGKGGLPRALLAALTFTLNWWEGMRGYLPANWDVLWSLSVEEVFYLLFPIACLLLLRRNTRFGMAGFLLLLAAFVVLGPLARALWTGNDVWQEKSYLGGMDAIALGCLTALLTVRLQRRQQPLASGPLLCLQGLGAALIALIFWYPAHPVMAWIGKTTLDGTVLALGTCLVLFPSVLRNRPGRAFNAPLRWFGRHSYEVYLTHEFPAILLTLWYEHRRHAGQATGPTLLWIVAMLLCAAPLGWLFARFWAIPLNRRLRPRGVLC